MSWITKVYLLCSLFMLALFAWIGMTGWERGARERRYVPEEVRAAPQGFRTFHYWHVGFGGYRGGK